MHKPIVGEGNRAGSRVASHDSPPEWVNGKAKPKHFEGISLLPACSASDVVYHARTICVAKSTSAIMDCFEIEEEAFGSSEVWNFVADLHSSVFVDTQRFACECLEGRAPIGLDKRIA